MHIIYIKSPPLDCRCLLRVPLVGKDQERLCILAVGRDAGQDGDLLPGSARDRVDVFGACLADYSLCLKADTEARFICIKNTVRRCQDGGVFTV
ncbi:hypothetical protein BaRGS_00035148 [Batillaria attramentaria]|uniref:Uncharacterized protein n=1 Tax=Batillaria attramentaria TaxID=370345 RepID=A0ABD0JFI9_9CAEN